MSKLVSNVCKNFCGITCIFEAWIRNGPKYQKLVKFWSLTLPAESVFKAYYQIVSIVKKNMKWAYVLRKRLLFLDIYFSWFHLGNCRSVVANEKGKFSLQRHKGLIYTIWDWDRSPHWYVFFNFSLLRKLQIFLKIPSL